MFEKLFGNSRHNHPDPWNGAPPIFLELGAMLYTILDNQERQMTAADDLKAAVSDLKTQMDAANAAIEQLLAQVANPPATGTADADVEAAVSGIRDAIASNQAEVAKVTPPAPPAT